MKATKNDAKQYMLQVSGLWHESHNYQGAMQHLSTLILFLVIILVAKVKLEKVIDSLEEALNKLKTVISLNNNAINLKRM